MFRQPKPPEKNNPDEGETKAEPKQEEPQVIIIHAGGGTGIGHSGKNIRALTPADIISVMQLGDWEVSLLAGSATIGNVNIRIDKTLKTAKIDHGSSGNNEIVAAVTGKKIKVYTIVLVVSNAVNCKWCSATTDLTGAMNFSSQGEGYAHAVQPPAFLLATAAGEALNLNLSAAVAVDGYVAYWDDDAT